MTAGVNLALTDGGAGGTATLNVVTQSATVFHNAAQSIPNNAWTTIALNGEVSDPQGWHDPTTNNARLYLPAGEYQVIVQNASFASNATGLRGVQVYDSDGNAWGANVVPAVSGWATFVNLTAQRVVTGSGKYVYVQFFQTSGGALDLNGFVKLTVNRLG